MEKKMETLNHHPSNHILKRSILLQQTPHWLIDFMLLKIPYQVNNVLEPMPGSGYLTAALKKRGYILHRPVDYFRWRQIFSQTKVDCIVANPPWTENDCWFTKHTPLSVRKLKGARVGYWFLESFLQLASHVVCIMPWYTIINSSRRTEYYLAHGLKEVYNLPRGTFGKSHVQVCLMIFDEDWDQGFCFFKSMTEQRYLNLRS